MATVNFSIPDEVQAEFDQAFGDQDKSAIVAGLMRKAAADATVHKQREETFLKVTRRRAHERSLANQARVARLTRRR